MAEAKRVERPLSPFMIGPYYRPQMTSISSIMVRITGIATLGTVFLVVAWLLAAATSRPAFDWVNWLLTSLVGDVLMTLAAWAIWYHALGRLRHPDRLGPDPVAARRHPRRRPRHSDRRARRADDHALCRVPESQGERGEDRQARLTLRRLGMTAWALCNASRQA